MYNDKCLYIIIQIGSDMTSKVNLKIFIPLIFLIIGILVNFYPVIMSHFHLFWADDTDGLLHIYLLEHNLSWFLQQYPHLSLFNPPFFYPDKNVLLYSDPYITATPFYALFRIFFDEKNSFTFLLMLVMALDFGMFYILLKNKFKLNILASSIGAYIFAFSLFNQIQLTVNHHSQMIYLFFVVISLYALLSVNKHNTLRQNCVWVIMFYLFIILSVYNVYAITWYYCFSLFLFMLSMLFFKRPRRKLIIFIRRFGKLFAVGLFSAMLMLFPLVSHYLQFNVVWGDFSTNTINDFFKNYSLYNLVVKPLSYDDIVEHNSGVEYFTLFLGLWGIYYFKRFRGVLFLFLLVLFLLSTEIGNMNLWYYIFNYFPGANGMRMNQRIIVVFYSVMAFGCAVMINDLCRYEKRKILNSLFVFCVSFSLCLFQETYLPKIIFWGNDIYNTISTTSIKVDVDKYSKLIQERNCKIISLNFLKEGKDEYPENWVDILNMKVMWVAQKNKVYTLNGYSGYKPEEPSRKLTAEEEAVLCRFKYDW